MKGTFIYILFLYFIVSQLCISQEVKIVKIHDTNLFELEDSSFIRLSGIYTPSKNDSNFILNNIIVEIYNYYYTNLHKRDVEIKLVNTSVEPTKFQDVILLKKYTFENVDINEDFLRNGFGYYYEKDSSALNLIYIEAQKEAMNKRRGIWKFCNVQNYKLNTKLEFTALEYFSTETDFTELQLENNESNNNPSIGNILLQIPVSLGLGVGFGIAGVYIGIHSAPQTDWSWVLGGTIGIVLGYNLGQSLGFHLIASSWNENLNFFYLLLSSGIGSLAGWGFGAVTGLGQSTGASFWFFPIGSFISSFLYTNVFSVDNNSTQASNNKIDNFNNGITHSDFYNQQRLFNFELFRLNF